MLHLYASFSVTEVVFFFTFSDNTGGFKIIFFKAFSLIFVNCSASPIKNHGRNEIN